MRVKTFLTALLVLLSCSLAGAANWWENLAINPNFELDANGNEALGAEREYTDCLAWTRGAEWGQVRPHDAWGDPHPTARMLGRLAWNMPANIYQDTGHLAMPHTRYRLTGDFKSDWCWQMDMKLHALDEAGAILATANVFQTMNNHRDWRQYVLELDTAARPEFVGRQLRIEFQMRDWDGGQLYVTNVKLMASTELRPFDPAPADDDDLTDGIGQQPLDLTVSWQSARNELGGFNTDVMKHYVHLSSGSPTDPNLAYLDEVAVSAIDPNYAEYALTGLNKDGHYYWQIEQGLDNGVGGVYPPGNENNLLGPVWAFETTKSVPVIATEPTDAKVFPGDDALFSVVATSDSPESYQWYRYVDGVADVALTDGADYSGTQTAELTVLDAQLGDEGPYYVIVSNGGGTATSQTAVVIIKRVMAHYEFEGTDPNTVIDSAGDNDGTPTVPITFSADAKIGAQSIDLNGVDQAVDVPRMVEDDMTISAWVKTTGTGGTDWWAGNAILDGEVSGSVNDFGLTQLGDIAAMYVQSAVARGTTPINDGQWHFVAATRDGTTGEILLYVDGIQEGRAVGITALLTSPPKLRIGGVQTGGYFFPGQIDDLQVCNYVKDVVGIADLFLAGMPDGTRVCILEYDSAMDLTGPDGEPDCEINLLDFAAFAAGWLSDGLYKTQLPE